MTSSTASVAGACPPSHSPSRRSGEDPDRLLELLATDREAGFVELVRSYSSLVYSVHLRLTGSHADADDLGQETFLRAYKALLDFSPERCRDLRPGPWLATVATNVWRNRLREKARRPNTVGAWDAPSEQFDEGPGPEHVADAEDGWAQLGDLLTTLPAHHREAIVLRHVVGLSYREMSELLGCPTGTLKARTSRGIGALRAKLEGRSR